MVGGAGIQSSRYKPLADNDNEKISKVLKSGDLFFKKIAYILLIYIAILCIVFPLLFAEEFDWIFTVVLILSISISFFAQYYFGIIDRILLSADQRGYIHFSSLIFKLSQ